MSHSTYNTGDCTNYSVPSNYPDIPEKQISLLLAQLDVIIHDRLFTKGSFHETLKQAAQITVNLKKLIKGNNEVAWCYAFFFTKKRLDALFQNFIEVKLEADDEPHVFTLISHVIFMTRYEYNMVRNRLWRWTTKESDSVRFIFFVFGLYPVRKVLEFLHTANIWCNYTMFVVAVQYLLHLKNVEEDLQFLHRVVCESLEHVEFSRLFPTEIAVIKARVQKDGYGYPIISKEELEKRKAEIFRRARGEGPERRKLEPKKEPVVTRLLRRISCTLVKQ